MLDDPELSPNPAKRARCREIATADLDDVIALLVKGFPDRSDAFWRRALYRLVDHPTPTGTPRYGHLLDCNGAIVGALLQISTNVSENGVPKRRVNLGSWYVDPEFRGSGMLLPVRALKPKDCTYWNMSPAPHTLPVMDRLGFTRYCRGHFLSLPLLNRPVGGAKVQRVTGDATEGLDSDTHALMAAHRDYGCISVVCRHGTETYPFLFIPRKRGFMRYAELIYCRKRSDFVRFAGTLGRYLALRGMPMVVLDSNNPVRGIAGKFVDNRPKYFKGPDRPRLWDLAYTEVPIFGV